MIRNFKGSLTKIFNQNNIYSLILIGILFAVQLVYENIPGRYLLSGLLATGAVFISIMKDRNLLKSLGTFVFIGVLYSIYLLSPYPYFSVVASNVAILWFIYTCLKYLTYEPFAELYKQKIIRILIALVYVAVVYLSIYIIVQLLNVLFNLKIAYDSWAVRIANAIAYSLGLLVLMYEGEEVLGKHSPFFKVIIGKILPAITIAMAVLSVALIFRNYFQRENNYILDGYYFIFSLLLIAYVLSELAGTTKKMRVIVGLSMAISILSYSLHHIQSNESFRNYGILINAIVATWLFYHISKEAIADKKYSIMIFVVSLILLLPPFGYGIYQDYPSFSKALTKGDSELKQFNERYVVSPSESESISLFYGEGFVEKELDISSYTKLIKGVNLNGENQKTVGDFKFKLSEDKRILFVENKTLEINEEIQIFDLINELNDSGPSFYRITKEKFMIDLKSYSYNEYYNVNNTNSTSTYISFDLYY